MKNCIFIIAALLAFHCTAKGQSKFTRQNRAMLKDFFLYSCIKYGFEDTGIKKKDHSGAVYIDLLRGLQTALSRLGISYEMEYN